jgi:hypothetical protein
LGQAEVAVVQGLAHLLVMAAMVLDSVQAAVVALLLKTDLTLVVAVMVVTDTVLL